MKERCVFKDKEKINKLHSIGLDNKMMFFNLQIAHFSTESWNLFFFQFQLLRNSVKLMKGYFSFLTRICVHHMWTAFVWNLSGVGGFCYELFTYDIKNGVAESGNFDCNIKNAKKSGSLIYDFLRLIRVKKWSIGRFLIIEMWM